MRLPVMIVTALAVFDTVAGCAKEETGTAATDSCNAAQKPVKAAVGLTTSHRLSVSYLKDGRKVVDRYEIRCNRAYRLFLNGTFQATVSTAETVIEAAPHTTSTIVVVDAEARISTRTGWSSTTSASAPGTATTPTCSGATATGCRPATRPRRTADRDQGRLAERPSGTPEGDLPGQALAQDLTGVASRSCPS